jgi:hypothetical protein
MYCKHINIYHKLLNVECTVTVIDRSHNKANYGIRDKSDSITIPIHNSCIRIVEGTEYPERQTVCPVVRIGAPNFLARNRVLLPPPLWVQVWRHTRVREKGWGDPIPPKGQTLWYSLCSVIPLRSKASTA